MAESEESQPHVLVFPFPAQGHLTCMLKLAELLSIAGIKITFLNSDYNHQRLTRFSAAFTRLSRSPEFRFRSIPDGIPDDKPRSSSRFIDLWRAMASQSKELFRDMLTSGDEWPPATCLIIDGLITFAFDVAEELDVPVIAFRTASVCSLWCYFCLPKLISNREVPFKCEEAEMDEAVRGIPTMEGFLRRRDLPSMFRNASEANDGLLSFLLSTASNACRAKGLILNSPECLEGPVLSEIRSICPTVYSVGPLHTLLESFRRTRYSPEMSTCTKSSSSASMWPEERGCIEWLDSQPCRSVVYVSFGSLTNLSREQLLEFWHGLVNSGFKFLWIIRQDLVNNNFTGGLSPPAELEKETKERGFTAAWAPQEEVLSHPSLGVFLTHAGWNSTLESIIASVPMICWPFFADQQLNSRYISHVWKIGLDMKDACDRDVVKKTVKEAMEGEIAEQLKKNIEQMSDLVKQSVAEGGSSYSNLDKLIEHVWTLSSKRPKGLKN